MDEQLDIVIVAYRGRDLLRSCLRSLREYPFTDGPMRITVVDNASGDGTLEMVEQEFPEVEAIGLRSNVGFSGANNVALRESSAPWVLLLNPDTEVYGGVLGDMVDFMRQHPSAGVAGCRLVRDDGSFDHAAKRSFPTVTSALRYFAPGGKSSAYLAPVVDEHAVGKVDAVNGAFMLVRRKAMDEVGLLDQGYWMYGEDLDWCFRFHEAGWKVLYNGEITVLHVKGGSSGTHRRWKTNREFHRAMGRFYRKHQSGRRPCLDLAVYVGIGVRLLVTAAQSELARRRRSVRATG